MATVVMDSTALKTDGYAQYQKLNSRHILSGFFI